MTEEQRKEQFSIAYVRAVAAAAGVKVDRPEVDDDSIDVRFSANSIAGSLVPPLVEAQLKCTAKHAPKGGTLAFPLDVKNYEDLRGRRYVPRYLIVLVVPDDPADWLAQSAKQLVLKKCATGFPWKSTPRRPTPLP